MKRVSRQHEATYSEVKRLLMELPFYWLNSNLENIVKTSGKIGFTTNSVGVARIEISYYNHIIAVEEDNGYLVIPFLNGNAWRVLVYDISTSQPVKDTTLYAKVRYILGNDIWFFIYSLYGTKYVPLLRLDKHVFIVIVSPFESVICADIDSSDTPCTAFLIFWFWL